MSDAGLFGLTWTWATAQGTLELLHPWVLLLLPLPLAVWRWLPAHFERIEAMHVPFFAPLARVTGQVPAPGAVVLRRGLASMLVLAVAWAFIVLAVAGPQWVDPPIERIESGRDLLLAVDLSQSMEEKDFPDAAGKRIERLTAVKRVLDEFVARRKGDRIGLVVFGSGAYVESTFTLDHALVRAQLDAARPGIAGPRTAIGDAIGLGVKLFDEQKTKHKVMILLTDGNDTASRMPPEKAAEIAAARGITVHAVGIGDPAAKGQDKVDVPALQAIAAKTRGRFFLGSDQRALAAIYTELDKLEKQDFQTLSYRPKHPLFQWPLGAAVLLLFALQAGNALALRSPGGGRVMPDISALAEFHFLRPWWLAGLFAVGLLQFALGHRSGAWRQWRGIVAAHLLPHLVVNRGRGRWFAPRHVLVLTLALACVALAGPAWQREPPPFVLDRAPLVIALDLSPSMNAVDVAPTRLARAKQKVRDLVALRAGARTALVAYAGDAHVVLPLTDDPKILTAYVDALASELMPVAGRKPSSALAAAEALLASEATPGSILFVTDAFPAQDLPAFAAHAKASENSVLALAVGTPQGGPVRTGPGRYAQSATGEKIIARLDAAGLEKFADADATLVSVTVDHDDVERIQRDVQTHLEQVIEQGTRARWRDAGYWLTLPLLVLVAFSFRRGWTVRW